MKFPTIFFGLLVVLIILLVSGCSTVTPVVRKFPDVPAILMIECPDLKKLHDEAKLSDVAKTLTINYTAYHECALKHNAWIDWYHKQKMFFEEVK